MVNVVFILCVVVVLSLTAFGINVDMIYDRESIVLAGLLTIVVRPSARLPQCVVAH